MQTMYDLVLNQAERTPGAVALMDDRTDRVLTYRELIAEVDRIAAGFAERGIGAGTRVATCLSNVFEHGLSILALQRLAAVPALINARLTPSDIGKLITEGQMSGAVVLPAPELTDAVTGALPEGAPLFTVGGDREDDFATCAGAVSSLPPIPRPDPEDPCIIFYTSGTTGLPKGVVLAHRTSEHRIVWLSTQAGLRHGPHVRSLGFMPLAHAIGFHGVFLVTLAYGGAYQVMSSFDPVAAIDLVANRELTYAFAAPTLYYAMTKAPNYAPDKMRSMQLALYGGATIDPKLLNHMDERWENCTVRHIYGTTETMCSGYNPDPVGDSAALRPGYYTKLKYVQLGGGPNDEIEPGEEGELLVDAKADTIFTEYLNRPDATAEKVQDGWYRTGDVISVDDRGYFTLRGRVDDMIRSGGENIHPEEVEKMLRNHPTVGDCAAIGLDDPHWGQIVVGCIVHAKKGNRANNVTELEAHAKASNLADFKRPRAYFFVEEIPRNPGNGNVLRRLLRNAAHVARDAGDKAYAMAQ